MNPAALASAIAHAQKQNMHIQCVLVKPGVEKEHKINIACADIAKVDINDDSVSITYGSGNMFFVDTTDIIGIQVAKTDTQSQDEKDLV